MLPVAVIYGQGEEFDYARVLACRLRAYVLFGYAEKVEEGDKTRFYNSAAICNREGEFIFNTRKTHLYYADEYWSQEGNGFKDLTITNLKGEHFKCSVGICMDLNPKGFTSGKYEFADFIKERDSEVILFPTNWIDHDVKDSKSGMYILNYWLERLEPLLAPNSEKSRCLVVANRVGK
jgi:protein N-terminal amidase